MHRATDYFGIAYYGFLALYSLYELFFGGEDISSLVVAPIFYAFAIYGALHVFLIPFYAIGKLLTKEKGIWEQIKGCIAAIFWSLICLTWIADIYLHPAELDSLLETSSLALMLITIIEILLRILFFQDTEKDGKMNIVGRLKRVDDAYPMGSITFAGFFMGLFVLSILYLPTARQNIGFIILSGSIIFALYLLLFEWINRKAGKRHQEHDHPMENLVVDGKKGQMLYQTQTGRLWSPWISVLAAIVSAFLTYNLLSFTMSQVPGRRLFILVFIQIYALLAWIRWIEIKGHKYGSSEAQA